jgi:chemotaxis protein CheZ
MSRGEVSFLPDWLQFGGGPADITSSCPRAPACPITKMPNDSDAQRDDLARQLHSALQALGYDTTLHKVAHDIPDAQERLTYVGQMTERAASKVLTLVEEARPACSQLIQASEALLATPEASADQWRALAQQSMALARAQQGVLDDIMMSQDFQDLSGQVINKVVGILSQTEKQLQELLVHSELEAPVAAEGELTGPQVAGKALEQDDVDDLLASLGF